MINSHLSMQNNVSYVIRLKDLIYSKKIKLPWQTRMEK